MARGARQPLEASVFGIRNRRRGRHGIRGIRRSGAKTAAPTPPPTHAGGQDDGSFTNSLKLDVHYWKPFLPELT